MARDRDASKSLRSLRLESLASLRLSKCIKLDMTQKIVAITVPPRLTRSRGPGPAAPHLEKRHPGQVRIAQDIPV